MKTAVEMPSAKAIEVVQVVGSKGSVQVVKTGEIATIKTQAGEKYRIIKKQGAEEQTVDNVVATKSGDNLELQYADGTHVTLTGFYQAQGASLELPANDAGVHAVTQSDYAASADNGNFVYAHGNRDTLMSMTQENHPLQMAVAEHTSVSNLPHYAQAATGVASDAAAAGSGAVGAGGGGAAGATGFGSGLSTAAMVGLGALGVGTVAIVASSGGGGDTAAAVPADTTPPTATAVIDTVTDNVGTITGVLASGGVTDDTSLALSGTITGTLGSGEVVVVYDGATKLGNATVSGSTWTYTDSTLVNNDHVSYTVKVVDAAGNASAASSAFTTVIDTVAPIAAATGATAVVDADSNAAYSAGDTITIKFSEAMDATTIALGDLVLSANSFGSGAALATVDATSFTVTLGTAPSIIGGETITIATGAVADVAGNISASPIVFTLPTDITPPATPTISTVAGDNIINAAEKTAGVAIAGVAESGSSVAVTLGSVTQTVTADATTGAYTTTFSSANIPADTASTTISVTATDVSGNVSTAATQAVKIDTVAPAVTINAVSTDDMINATEKTATVTVTGTNETGATTTLNTHAVTQDTATTWSYVLDAAAITAMLEGAETLTAVSTDVAGNSTTATHNITVDTVAPTFTSTTAVSVPENITTTVYTAIATGAATYALSGTDAALFNIVSATGAVTFKIAPDYEIPTDTGPNNVYDITVTATDTAGNAMSQNIAITVQNVDVTIDTVAGDDTINAAEATAGVTLTGTNEPSASVTVNGNTALVSGTTWSYLLDTTAITAMLEGSETLTIFSGGTTITKNITIDTVSTTPTITAVTGDNIINAAEKTAGVAVAGVAEAGSSVAVTLGGVTQTVTADATTGAYTTTFATANIPADTASTTISVTATDIVGNVSTAATQAVKIDTVAPIAATTGAIIVADTDHSATYNVGDTITIKFSEAMDTTTVTLGDLVLSGGHTFGSGATLSVVDSTSFRVILGSAPTVVMSDTITVVTGTVADVAGNVSTSDVVFTVPTVADIIAPTVSSIALSGGTGQNGYYNAGDWVNVTVTMSEATFVTGAPTVALNIGGTIVQASYNSGSGTSSLLFVYQIQSTQTDTNGISINANSITLNGGALADAANNAAVITHLAVADNASYKVDNTVPTLVDVSFVAGANTALSVTFSESILLVGGTTFLLNGVTPMTPTGSSITGSTVTVTFAGVTTTSSDYILMNAPSGAITDLAGNPAAGGIAIAGSNGDSTIDLSTLQASYNNMAVYGSTGNDTIIGTNNQDYIIGGEGRDTISSRWGNDIIDFSEITKVQDVIMMTASNGSNSTSNSPDTVYHFDVSGTGVNDAVGVGIAQIGANVGITNGTDSNTVAQHSITAGIVSFFTSGGAAITINTANYYDAIAYLDKNLAANATVGFEMDTDNSGSVDSLAVYQHNTWGDTAVAILDGITGKTLGTTAAANVVHIADKVGPEINGAVFVDNNTLTLSFNEALLSTTISDANTDLQIGNGATIGGIVAGTYTPSGATLTIDTGANTWGTSSYVVMTTTATVTDAAGNISTFFDPGEKGVALGNTATSLIDIHTLTGDYSIVNMLSTATAVTLIGNDGNNYIEGTDAVDTITGGKGADDMDAGNGDKYIIHQGDSTLVTFHENNATSGVNNGDTFTFVNGADTINFWGMTSGSATIQLDSAMFQGSLSSTGTVGDDDYALVKGWYDGSSGVFNVDSGGSSTLVVYDGTVGSGISQTAFVLREMSSGTLTLNDTTHVITAVI